MRLTFRLFAREHGNGFFTLAVPGLSGCAVYGSDLDNARNQVRDRLRRYLTGVTPARLHQVHRFDPHQRLQQVRVMLRAGQGRRKTPVELVWSLLLTPEGERWRVEAPVLVDPPLVFFARDPAEAAYLAEGQLADYFRDRPEELLNLPPARLEWLEELPVEFAMDSRTGPTDDDGGAHRPARWPALAEVGRNLTEAAAAGELAAAHGRDAEVTAVLAALAGPVRPQVILVGPPGTGKTAVAHEAVRRIQSGACPPALQGKAVWATSALEIVAGQKYIGEWQGRMQRICRELSASGGILFLEDAALLAEVGRSETGDENMAQFLKPYLQSGQIRLMGECIPERMSVLERLEPAFHALLRTLSLPPATPDESRPILRAVADRLKERYRVDFEPGALQAAIDLTQRFQPHRVLPGKAVALLEQAAAAAAPPTGTPPVTFTRSMLVERFAAITGLPRRIILDEEPLDPSEVERFFAERLLGQPEAVQSVVDLITVIKAGLGDPHKPLGVFLFVGPTGVGKTELAKTVAEFLFGSRERLIRLDMSEYMDHAGVDRLVGVPWHRGQEGELTRRVRQQPLSVLLLDEIEKAHPAVFDLLLQVLGEGRLTDATGRATDFRSAIIIMTSNLGAAARERRSLGFGAGETAFHWENHFRAEAERFFRPEFLGRIDRMVAFQPLDAAALRRVAQRELGHLLLREGIVRRGLLVEIDPAVLDLILERGVSPEYGARPLKREIERAVILPLARYLVARSSAGPQLIRLVREGDEVRIAARRLETAGTEPNPAAARTAPRSLQEAAGDLAKLRERLQQFAAVPAVRRLDQEKEALLEATGGPTFWDDAPAAHRVLARIYHLERVLRRLDQLSGRAEHLAEFSAVVMRQRDQRYLPDLTQAREDLERDVTYLEVECLTAHLPGRHHAAVQVSGVGPGERGWPARLAAVYVQWALTKGYEFRLLLPGAGGWTEVPPRQTRAAVRELVGGRGTGAMLAVAGANVFGFLAGETGIHQETWREGATERAELARVAVAALEEHEYGAGPAAWAERLAAAGATDEPARLYVNAGERYVRDPRTGLRTPRLKEVLQGKLDEFLLAYLRDRADAGT